MIVTGQHLRPFFTKHCGPVDDGAEFIGRWEGNRLLGCVGFWSYDGINIEVGWCGQTGWLTRGFLRVVFAFVFGQLGCRRITGRIDANNAIAIEQTIRLGFVHEGTMRDAGHQGDVLIYGLKKSECRYYGQEIENAEGSGRRSDQAHHAKRADESGQHLRPVRQSDVRKRRKWAYYPRH